MNRQGLLMPERTKFMSEAAFVRVAVDESLHPGVQYLIFRCSLDMHKQEKRDTSASGLRGAAKS